jgi:hypothetical protein
MHLLMNKRNIFAGAILVLSSLMISCTKDFEEINTNPNRISEISPGTLLNPILYEVASFNMERADGFTFDLMQVSLPFPSVTGGLHRYELTENTGNSTWNTYYRWITNVKEMHAAAVKYENPNYQAIALTLNAWIYSNLTDAFGDVPMEEAGRGDEGIFRPRFNKQEEIYAKLLADLEEANSLYSSSNKTTYGTDILFENDFAKWRKFTNSLHMRLLLRLSNRPEMNTYAKLRTMIDNPAQYPVIANNAESAILETTGIDPMVSPWGRPQDFTAFRAASEFFVDNLVAMNDPRLPRFVSKASGAPTTYKGIPSGFDPSTPPPSYTPSNLQQSLVIDPVPMPILTYAEVQFIKAEVEFKAGNSTKAQEAYEKGVKSAIEQWGLVMPADYFTNPATAYDGTLERIMLQKYFSLFFVDYQQWFEYRRTGLPTLPKNAGMENNGIMPSRLLYPIDVRESNAANYQEAVGWMGGDDINTKVWWERP